MKFTKTLSLVLCASLFSFLLGGCSSSGSKTQTFAWPLGTASPEDTVTQIFAEKFAEETERLSNGTMKIKVYPNSTLGGDRDLLESCKDGDIPFVVQNTAPQVTFMKDLAIFDLPAVFDSIEEVREKVDDPLFSSLVQDVYLDAGYRLLGAADQGFRVMSINREISSILDFQSQKIRTMENPYHLSFWKELNASPTPMSFSEVYIGLQQHTIDAQENPYEVIVSNRLYEQQKYVVETNHLPHLITLIISEDFYQDLSPEQQAVLNEAASIASAYAREQSDLRIDEKREVIKDSGASIVTLDEETREAIRQASEPVYEQIREAVSPELYEAYTS